MVMDAPVSETSTEDEKTVYELGYHLVPILSKEEVVSEAQAIKETIENNGGALISEESPRNITLAYTIAQKVNNKQNKYDSAFFGWYKFHMTPEEITSLTHTVDKQVSILRFLIIKTVREKTVVQHRTMTFSRPAEQKPIKKPVTVKLSEQSVPISDEELDKTIEKLVAE